MKNVLKRSWWLRFRLDDEECTGSSINGGRSLCLPLHTDDNLRDTRARLREASGFLILPPWRWHKQLRPSYGQRSLLMILAATCLLVLFLGQWALGRLFLYPAALVSTAFHEFGHALVAVLTGGSVASIEVAPDESGLTRFRGGWQCAVLPAGYVGSTLAGALLLFSAFGRRASKIAGFGCVIVLIIVLWFASDIFTFIAAASLAALISWLLLASGGVYVRHVVAVLGVAASLQATSSILASTVFASIPQSDATVFANKCSIILPGFVYGLLWLLISYYLIAVSLAWGIVFFRP
jgi:hypothetical protein